MTSHRGTRESPWAAAMVAVVATIAGAVTETVTYTKAGAGAGATPLDRSGRWRGRSHWRHRWDGPPGTPRITGPASASASSLSRAVIFLLISCWVCLGAAAASISVDQSPRPTTLPATDTEVLLIDPRIPVFVDGHWRIMSDEEHRELRRRAAAPKETETAQATRTTEVVIDASTVTDTANPASTTTAAASPLPSPFDGALAANFSGDDVCPTFINDFLSNATFKACYPISLLLQGSQSFFEAEKSFFSITQVLDAACAADVDMCTDYFNTLASSLISDDNCGQEYDRENALVVQAYQGMKTYNTVYKATCLPNEDSKSREYCFANAITNNTTPSNAYLYYLPFNSTLPANAAPSCGSCTQQTMGIYQDATSNRKADISNTYIGAAEQINLECGTNFVNTTLAAAVQSGATTSLYTMPSSWALLFSFTFMAISHWI
ncbi:hypothetical protein F5Y12DRAFT_727931 [Xylaria sp. FL1777]|nr:hypothetical protein F5Y12DRAFT_727931 [Xylaria sp. FL1777]